MATLTRFKNSVTKFHNDERGLEALQTVMILAVAAVALIVIKGQWTQIEKFFRESMAKITGGKGGEWAGQNGK